jgi:hypothetical protein
MMTRWAEDADAAVDVDEVAVQPDDATATSRPMKTNRPTELRVMLPLDIPRLPDVSPAA